MKAKLLKKGQLCHPNIKGERADICNFNTLTVKKINPWGVFEIVETGQAYSKNGVPVHVGRKICFSPLEEVILCEK